MRRAYCPSSRPAASGFTLLELLAAIAILAIVSTLLFAAFNQASKVWLMTERRVEISEQARAAFDLFARELSQAILHTNPPVSRQMTLQGGRDWVAFLAASVDTRTNQPDVLITYQGLPTSNGLFSLYRTIDTQGYQGGPATRLTANRINDVIVENLVPMDGGSSLVLFSNTQNGVQWNVGPDASAGNPVAVSLSLRIIDSRAAARLARGADYNEIVAAESQTFYIKVYLPNR